MTKDIDVLKALPVLQKIWNTHTLADYFKTTISSLAQIKETPEKKMMVEAITQEAERLYGKETANNVHKQICTAPIVETGTHLAFLRDYDSPQKDDLRSRLNQNVLISSALMHHIGQPYHIGVYGSNVSLNHPCGGGFFQLGDDIFPVTALRQIDQTCLYDAPAIEQKHFNEALPLSAKLRMLSTVLTDDIINRTSSPRKEMLIKTRKIINCLLGPINNGKTNYETVAKQYQALNSTNQNFIKTALLSLAGEAYKKYGYTFSDVDKQYHELQEIFDRKDLKLPDQVALAQAKTINKILAGSGIQHLSIDAIETVRKFLISALDNKESLWYKIFNNTEMFKQLHQSFIGLRGSWKENESPFDYVGRSGGFAKCISLPLDAIDHKPETLSSLLKEKKIIPSNTLMVLLFQSSSIMAHGGFFQTTYADKIKKRFISLLLKLQEIDRAKQLQKLPVDMALLSLAILKDSTDTPMKLSEISRMPVANRQALIKTIPQYPSCRAVMNALPVLKKYLETTAPGYIETEAQNAHTPLLKCQHNTPNTPLFHVHYQQNLRRVL